MWWASVSRLTPGLSFASFAIRSSLVEMSCELCVSVIVSLQRVCSSARSFARQGPLERVPPRHRSYCALRPLGARPAQLSLAVTFLSLDRTPRLHPRFLGNPCVHAPFFDPGEWCE